MIEEMEFMTKNKVKYLVQLPYGYSIVGCKWIYKTKRNAFGKIE